MNFRSLVTIIACCAYVNICLAKHLNNYESKHHTSHLKEIPKRFEIKGDNANFEFRKYLNEISELAKKENVTVKYKVKVEVSKKKKRRSSKENMIKGKSKKYNVPLKKKNMKLSNLELIMRKHVESMASKTMVEVDQNPVTTEKQPLVYVTRSMFIGKYKPIIGQVRTNYSKIIKPVRNKIITFTF